MTENALSALRLEARAWLEEHFPRHLAGVDVATLFMRGGDVSAAKAWTAAIADKGWGVPTWPQEYGGAGLEPVAARVVQQEMARIGARNPIGGIGVLMLGPTLLEFGDAEQKARHLPPIARGELRWCQGYSEPGAGSDLASLQTKAEDRGDHFLVNGQKTWTSGGEHADWCFCLVRTDTSRKQEGISFLLIDMASPGIEVAPIDLISGNSPFCETFFTDVAVPKANLVGPLNGGWRIAKRLLEHERSGLSSRGGGTAARGGDSRPLHSVAEAYLGLGADGRLADGDLRTRIAAHQIDQKAFSLTLERAAAESRSGQAGGATASILKNAGARLAQERAEILMEIMGHQGLGWAGEGFDANELATSRMVYSSKAVTIYGGTQEIQNNVIAKRILGLPDPV